MKRKPIKRSNGFTAQRKPMKAVSAKKAAHRRSKEGQAEKQYMADVATLDCCACGAAGPSEVHHPIHDRYGTSRSPNFDVIPLCPPCHRIGPNAIHNGKESWREKHGPDYSYIEATRRAVSRL